MKILTADHYGMFFIDIGKILAKLKDEFLHPFDEPFFQVLFLKFRWEIQELNHIRIEKRI